MNTAKKLELQINTNKKNASANKTRIGKNIKIAMAISGIKQTELAKMLNTTQGTISKWITDRQSPDIYQLKQLSEIFKKSMEWFFKEIQ